MNIVPYPSIDTYVHGMNYLTVADMGRLAQINRKCRAVAKHEKVLTKLFQMIERLGIPRVTRQSGKPLDSLEDLKVLYPITASKTLHRLGKVVAQIPPISEALFNRLLMDDPDLPGTTIRDNYVLIVDPCTIMREVEENDPLDMDSMGQLCERIQGLRLQKDLIIPATMKNLVMLWKYPLEEEPCEVYKYSCLAQGCPVLNPAIVEWRASPKSAGVYLLSKSVGGVLREKDICLTETGYIQAPSRIRYLYECIVACNTGHCPECKQQLTLVEERGYPWLQKVGVARSSAFGPRRFY